jgi:pyrophosphatase PpaX
MAFINTVLFDFDGTIMDTNDVIIRSWQHTFRRIEGKERPLADILSTFGEPLLITMAKLFPQMTAEEGAEIYRDYMKQHFNDLIHPFPGMGELFEALKIRGQKLGLVTSRVGETTRAGLEQFDLLQYFDCIITCDDTNKHKPDPEPILIAMDRLGSKPSETIMVGDTTFDLLSAKNAGVKSVLVGWQMALSEEEIQGPEGPDYVAINTEDLLKIIDGKESVNS